MLLGAQRFEPSLGEAVGKLRVSGRIATITAGWQERESEDEELAAHLGGKTVNLRLHARGDELFKEDPELRDAHRDRQAALRHRQDFYRIRLEHSLAAELVIRTQKREAPADVVAEQTEASINAIRELDAAHLATCARLHAAFEALFGISELVAGRIVFAWSGGAMAVSERVVLFHDDPPQGAGASEVLDAGLGLVPGVVVLPQPETRLRLERKERVQGLVRRFAPALCLALPARSRVTWHQGRFSSPDGVIQLRDDGEHAPFLPQTGDAP